MKSEKANNKSILDSVNMDLLKIDFRSKYQRLLGTARLLKERKEELQAALAEIEDIYHHAPCGYHSLNDKGIFLRINDTELRWLDETRASFGKEKKFSDILTNESREIFEKLHPVFLKTGRMENAEFNFVRKDGSCFPVLVNATAVYDKQGNYTMSRSVVLDISARKLMEEELHLSHKDLQLKNDALTVANENLFFLNREKERFMDIASHDLQLPVAAVAMLSETLKNRNLAPGSPEEGQVFEMIHDASLEMKALLANYLSANLSETGRMELFLTEIDLRQLTEDIVNRYIPVARKKNITIYFKTNKNFLLYTDRECCSHIIDNLLSNAVKYTLPGKNVTVAVTGNQKEAKIIIADEGPGIRREDHHLLFQRFQKLSARPTGGELSTGLGLSIVKYLVDQLKGSITVESEPGQGSVFYRSPARQKKYVKSS